MNKHFCYPTTLKTWALNSKKSQRTASHVYVYWIYVWNHVRTPMESEVFETAPVILHLYSICHIFFRVMNTTPLVTCYLSTICSRMIIEWKRPSFTVICWAHNLEDVIERPLFDSSSCSRLTLSSCRSLFTAGSMESFGKKNALSWCWKIDFWPTQILSVLHVNLFPFALHEKKNCFLQEVCNKSLAIDDNGICACVCHLRKSNSGGVSTDLFVY